MPHLITRLIVPTYLLAIASCSSEPSDERRVWEDESGILVLVELTPADHHALLAAPKMFMNNEPSIDLEKAIRNGSVDRTKVQFVSDKVDGKIVNNVPPTYQGWIYYTAITLDDGTPYTPAVLCVSQSEEIQWFFCQDESDNVTQRLAKNRLRESDK
jgi:hypothetical protein